MNRIVIIGNGFDLAHGLKTAYKDFLHWYVFSAFKLFGKESFYEDELIKMDSKEPGYPISYPDEPTTTKAALDIVNHYGGGYTYKSHFLKRLLESHDQFGWVDIECRYFSALRSIFINTALSEIEKSQTVRELNNNLNFLTGKLTEYLVTVNNDIGNLKKLPIENPRLAFREAMYVDEKNPVTFLTFNYTDTLSKLGYADEHEIIHIHGRVSEMDKNPIVFGYGDETNPIYQAIEDSGQNIYLEHIKSFAYFQTSNYNRLISTLDSEEYTAYIFGHSCGLSDRVLLQEIFEHQNCKGIEVFYHQSASGNDNYKEITQELSRHFKAENKGLMRRKVAFKNSRNIIPQIK